MKIIIFIVYFHKYFKKYNKNIVSLDVNSNSWNITERKLKCMNLKNKKNILPR